jgi:uncharacterized membrane protein (UPF0182 family)
MKKILSIVTLVTVIALVMSSCSRKADSANSSLTTPVVAYEDTVGFAQFQAWKAMNERIDPNEAFSSNVATKKPVAKKKYSSTKTGSLSSTSSNNAMVAKKKGWSKTAKYSAIGGGAGILLGSIINKRNRVLGGVIGGVIGGGLGYGIGRSQDKKDGRR